MLLLLFWKVTETRPFAVFAAFRPVDEVLQVFVLHGSVLLWTWQAEQGADPLSPDIQDGVCVSDFLQVPEHATQKQPYVRLKWTNGCSTGKWREDSGWMSVQAFLLSEELPSLFPRQLTVGRNSRDLWLFGVWRTKRNYIINSERAPDTWNSPSYFMRVCSVSKGTFWS